MYHTVIPIYYLRILITSMYLKTHVILTSITKPYCAVPKVVSEERILGKSTSVTLQRKQKSKSVFCFKKRLSYLDQSRSAGSLPSSFHLIGSHSFCFYFFCAPLVPVLFQELRDSFLFLLLFVSWSHHARVALQPNTLIISVSLTFHPSNRIDGNVRQYG